MPEYNRPLTREQHTYIRYLHAYLEFYLPTFPVQSESNRRIFIDAKADYEDLRDLIPNTEIESISTIAKNKLKSLNVDSACHYTLGQLLLLSALSLDWTPHQKNLLVQTTKRKGIPCYSGNIHLLINQFPPLVRSWLISQLHKLLKNFETEYRRYWFRSRTDFLRPHSDKMSPRGKAQLEEVGKAIKKFREQLNRSESNGDASPTHGNDFEVL